jgi:outer membrane lipoprotein-sorting protein
MNSKMPAGPASEGPPNVIRLAIVTLFAATLAGCAPKRAPDLPAYPWQGESAALAELRARAESVRTVSAECTIRLERPDGQNVQLDAALVMRRPDHVRLRAWKFSRAVFDLTLNDDGLWVMTMDDPARRDDVLPASVSAAEFVREWSYLTGGLFAESGLTTRVEGDTLFVTRANGKAEDGNLTCEVDRRTLTPRRYVYEGSADRFELRMENYRSVGATPWPARLVAASGSGTVVVEQRNVEINGELAENAFTPPRRAEKRQ